MSCEDCCRDDYLDLLYQNVPESYSQLLWVFLVLVKAHHAAAPTTHRVALHAP